MAITSPRYNGTVFWFAFLFLKSAHFFIVSSDLTLSTDVGVGNRPMKGFDVIVDVYPRKLFSQNLLAKFIYLYKLDSLNPCPPCR